MSRKMNIESDIPARVVFRCLEKMLGLVLVEEDVKDHGELRRCWTIRSAREYVPFISASYDWPLRECDRGCQSRCNVRFSSRKAAAKAVLERIYDFSWCNSDCVAVKTAVNPLRGRGVLGEAGLEILSDLYTTREKKEKEAEDRREIVE